MAGRLLYSGGEWIIKPGAYEAPEIPAFTEDDLRGNLTVRTKIQRRDLFNAVKGVFISTKNNYQPGDFPPVKNDDYMAEDNGERIWKDIELPLTGSEFMAQRLAKIDLEAGRRQTTISLPCSLKGLRVRAGDTISLTLSRMGWTDKAFLVTEWDFAVHEVDDAPVLGTAMQLKEIDAAIFDITAAEQQEMNEAPGVTTGTPEEGVILFVHGEGDLVADEDLPPKVIYIALSPQLIISATLISHGTATGIDNSNTCVISLYRNSDLMASLTFNTGTPFPPDGDALSFGSLANATFAANDKLNLEVINGTTADPPAFSVQVQADFI
jgi:hypothetical protein